MALIRALRQLCAMSAHLYLTFCIGLLYNARQNTTVFISSVAFEIILKLFESFNMFLVLIVSVDVGPIVIVSL